jgi:hypothetical protein
MAGWSIYYGSGAVVSGRSRSAWVRAPDEDVQVVVLWEEPPIVNGYPFRPWTGVSDRQLWTGEDTYDPFDYGHPKRGKLMDRDEYERIARRAFYGKRP